MRSFLKKTTWLFFIVLAITSCSKKEECDPEDEESPCYAGLSGKGKGTSECSYKVKIEGLETLPNQFGKDKIVITTETEGDLFSFAIFQKKMDPTKATELIAMAHGGPFNSKLAVGNHTVGFFGSTVFNTPQISLFPLYGFEEKEYGAGKLSFSILENSEKKIRMRISGTAMKQIRNGNDTKDVGLVPVEAEITVGRKHVTEATINGVLIAGAVCECQN